MKIWNIFWGVVTFAGYVDSCTKAKHRASMSEGAKTEAKRLSRLDFLHQLRCGSTHIIYLAKWLFWGVLTKTFVEIVIELPRKYLFNAMYETR